MTDHIKDATNAARKAANKAGYEDYDDDIKSAGETASRFVKDIKDEGVSMAKEGVKYLKDHGANDLHRFEEYVSANPTKSIAFAVLGGMFLNHILSHR